MTMTPTTLCAIVVCVFVAIVVVADLGRKQLLRARQRRFDRDRVVLEEVTAFKVRGCRHCGSSGIVKRQVPGSSKGAAKMPMPCGCAANAFLKRHGAATQMLGPFRVWKRGRRPANVLRADARRAVGGAQARAA